MRAKLVLYLIMSTIFRQENGLAMSSRNQRLSEEAKEKSTEIYKILKQAKELFATSTVEEVLLFVKKAFNSKPEFTLEYFVIADEANLQTASIKEAGKKYRAFVVVHIENVRLIDNLAFN